MSRRKPQNYAEFNIDFEKRTIIWVKEEISVTPALKHASIVLSGQKVLLTVTPADSQGHSS